MEPEKFRITQCYLNGDMHIPNNKNIIFLLDSRKRKFERVYEVGDRVYLHVSPLRGFKCFGFKGKLAPRFVGPYKVLEHIGEVAYKLEFPEGLSGVHDVFHVS